MLPFAVSRDREQEAGNVEQGPVGRPAVLRVVANEIEKHEKFILYFNGRASWICFILGLWWGTNKEESNPSQAVELIYFFKKV